MDTAAATIIAGPGESGFRAAIAAAQDGDTVMLTNSLRLQSTVTISKPITIRVDPGEAWRIWIEAQFDGALLDLSTNGIVLDGLRMVGSTQTDALRAEGTSMILRDCIIANCRRPVVSSVQAACLRLERVTVSNNQEGIYGQSLEAKDCTFSGNGGWSGIGGSTVELDGCVIEDNHGIGLGLINGTVKNCVFRYNTDFALWFDPDNGYLCLKSCLFYANAGGGAYLGEGGYATVDNCTFTRHTGSPAVFVTTDAHDIFLRHCTVADNVALESDPPHWLFPPAAFWIGSSARLENCLIADNPIAEDPNASGLVGTWIDGGGNVIGGPAHLSSLRDNGGPTLSLLPLAGSPAIDAGRPSDVVSDARGLSRLAGAAPDAGAIETGAGPVADTDADGIPDIWERLHGLNPDDPADASSDSDGDGQSARAEFGSGTDPADRQSVHRTEELIAGRMSIAQPYPRWGYLTWTRHPGVFYHVEASNDLRTWSRLPDTGSPGGSSLWWSLGLIEANSPSTFYRVIATK
jgi:hypothetical protein